MMNLDRVCVQDVDECLTNSVKSYFTMTPKIARKFGLGWPEAELPTYDELLAQGGTHKAYGRFPEYRKVNDFLRNDRDFNVNQEPIEGSREALNELDRLGLFDFYLTTRPESLAAATLEQLINLGFPKREVVARPDSVPLERTAEWKVSVLEEKHRQYHRPRLMIDDSLTTINLIKERKHPAINAILFKGPMTPPGNGELNWKEIVGLLKQSNSWETLTMKLMRGRE